MTKRVERALSVIIYIRRTHAGFLWIIETLNHVSSNPDENKIGGRTITHIPWFMTTHPLIKQPNRLQWHDRDHQMNKKWFEELVIIRAWEPGWGSVQSGQGGLEIGRRVITSLGVGALRLGIKWAGEEPEVIRIRAYISRRRERKSRIDLHLRLRYKLVQIVNA